MENDDSGLRFLGTFHNVNGGEGVGLGLQVTDERANEMSNNEMLDFDGDVNEKSKDLLQRINDVDSTSADRWSTGVEMDVTLNLGMGGEPSSSSSSAIVMGRENCDRDTQNKRPKVHSFSLDWGTSFKSENYHVTPAREDAGDEDLPDFDIAGDKSGNDSDDASKLDGLEVRMDLTDDLLHMVLSFLDHIDLCRAARVCMQWRDASSHEDFWGI